MFFYNFVWFIYSCFLGNKYIKKYDLIKNIDGKFKNVYFFSKEELFLIIGRRRIELKKKQRKKFFFNRE